MENGKTNWVFADGDLPPKDGGALEAVYHAVVLEECAMMALQTRLLNPDQTAISQNLLDKHYQRKHGSGAYYGQ